MKIKIFEKRDIKELEKVINDYIDEELTPNNYSVKDIRIEINNEESGYKSFIGYVTYELIE